MKSRNVTHLQTTKALFIPTHRSFTRSTLTSADTKMVATDAGVECSDTKHDYFIPWHMIEVAVFERKTDAKEATKAA